MSSWEREKDKYLKMRADEKHKNSISLEKIPTWKHMSESEKLPNPVKKMDNCPIDASLNEKLAEKISIFEGDITKLAIDAIVNAANSSLQGGGGVDGAIHRAAGSFLKLEGATLAPCKTGDAKITGGYQLPAKYVIHTVGPRLDRGQLENSHVRLLENCYSNSLQLLVSKNLRSIAFPCISTGIYGYPNLPAAHTAAYEVRKFLEKEHTKVDRVIFCLFLQQDKQIYREVLQSYFPPSH
ncbi:ADP-ribose glycohydrolase MACROD2-like [Coccinella septempunctata]|uniref:ADP-ribose glycohydrolase MACROD2-like n=1 Tax=Coccinella septempunctata TaxID=41139 RepID=UPI001D08662F|nr:ADP-ribose glycohydrolase MACROD2-like [Coccinella septempunctata]